MESKQAAGQVRLDKWLAQATGQGRKQAHKWVRAGKVCVDGKSVRDSSLKVGVEQRVTLAGEPVSLRGPVYLMLNKPLGVVCATEDAEHETVLDLLEYELQRDVHPAGRLDIDTTGLVLLTDDGQWSHRITSPRRACSKRYRVLLTEPLSLEQCHAVAKQFAEGVMLRGESKPTLPAELIFDPELELNDEVELVVQEGRYHQVKRMFAAIGNRVDELHREQIGELLLDPDLAPGEYRRLTEQEVALF